MNSRTCYGEEFEQFLDSCIPITPEKLIPSRSNLLPIDGHGYQFGRTNCQQLPGFPVGYVQNVPNYSRAAQHTDQTGHLYRNGGSSIRDEGLAEVIRMVDNQCNYLGQNTRLLENIMATNATSVTSQNTTLSGSMGWSPLISSLHSQVNNCREPTSESFLPNRAHSSSLMNNYGFCMPYDLNSPPRLEAQAASKFTQVEPDQAKKLESQSSSTEVPDIERLNEQGIDLNKTPQQKAPKRRKHRPKVIVEGKQKRAPKTASSKNTDPKEKTEKRKYVRRALKESETQNAESTMEATTPSAAKRKYVRKQGQKGVIQHADPIVGETRLDAKTNAKSCRRALRFDLETTTDGRQDNVAVYQEDMLNRQKIAFDLNSSFPAADSSIRTNIIYTKKPTKQVGQQNRSEIENQQSGALSIRMLSMNQGQRDSLPTLESQEAADNLSTRKSMHMQNLNLNASRIGQSFFSQKTNCQIISQNTPQSVPKIPTYLVQSRGSKRMHCQIEKTSSCTMNLEGSFTYKYNQNGSIPGTGCSDQKRKKTEIGIQTNTYCMPSCVGAVKYPSERCDHLMVSHNSQKQYSSSAPHLCIEGMGETNQLTLFHNSVSLASIAHRNMLPKTPSKTSYAPDLRKHVLNNHQELSAKRRGRPPKQKFSTLIEQITYQMEVLSLNARKNNAQNKEQNALVPYQGGGTLVPYDEFEYVKKRKPRPKVDLDPESDRVWKLLMGKEGGEGLEGTDKEKEEHWEKERGIFHGRVDSFIARMHLVQGDRRFSKWKGSVVDSVIGVFLTQNVSDHLSSSAFMSLAALFPLKSRRNVSCDRGRTNIVVEEPAVSMLDPDNKWNDKLFRYPLCSQSSMTHHESKEPRRESETSGIERTSMVEAQSQSLEEEFASSQDSFDSSIVQANGVISCSGSNSETEDPAGCKPSKSHVLSFMDLLLMENNTSLEEFYGSESGISLLDEGSRHKKEQAEDIENRQQGLRLEILSSLNCSSAYNQQTNHYNPQMQGPVVHSSKNWLQMTAQSNVQQAEDYRLCHEESISSWPSNSSTFSKENATSCATRNMVEVAKNVGKTDVKQYEQPMCQENLRVGQPDLVRKQSMCEQSTSQSCHESCAQERINTLQWQNTSVAKPVNLAGVQSKKQNSYRQHVSDIPDLTANVFDVEESITSVDKQKPIGDKAVESDRKEMVHPSNKVNPEADANKLKAKGKEKDAVHWDGLRKQVQENGRKERTEGTMDSLDYEAMRCASVEKISDAIKERGMNNMLAERMKEFLNRLVREHGSIDLEWLRDVPPDRAKDFLLSIRGLGLKSVECVRLLTLHHLAFPVDTNVGRIAVRLGWVPLQPLPESLQLHLLELYPILETIQKYLWPRLCKLDQRTLYELHYQMITFGKVFCTKSKPNCNACPMRAECRHFASAFASARLALPGPEEKTMTTSTVPFMPDRSPGRVINPMPLPQAEHNLYKRIRSDIGSCVPIIEEPTTPDQEDSESKEPDMEDFGEDPNEIPTINLNIEEFTENLRNYMHSNMELQEGDMSKALVALNPYAASIPAPKLKSVSRLRTEHLVYELPDSHPLLNGLDRREPDDPSPYLLAIWTPGETANSIALPQQKCQSLEPDKLCDEKTCVSCNSIREANSQTVRGTLLIPCRTAMRGSFPLNGTYFQVNEVFADHESSLDPTDVPRKWLWNLPRRTVYFGTSVSSIFKGLSTEGIQQCFWKGFVCVRGFERKTRAPRPLRARLHFPASKLVKAKNENKL